MATSHRGFLAAATLLGSGIMLATTGCVSTPPSPPPAQYTSSGCPPWWQFPADKFSNAGSPYLGCVTSVDVRAMLADPADWLHGRPVGRSDAEREARAIEAYQQGRVKPFLGSGSMSPQTSGGSGPQ
jgi:type IV pilus biogenesis protein CpaD/CtpE